MPFRRMGEHAPLDASTFAVVVKAVLLHVVEVDVAFAIDVDFFLPGLVGFL